MSTSDFSLPAGTVTVVSADWVIENTARVLDSPVPPEKAVTIAAIVGAQVTGHGGIRLNDASTVSCEAVFSRVGDAVSFALAAQEELAGAGIPIRIGVHTGDLGDRGPKWDATRLLERADRLRRAGHDQQILLSGAAFAIYEGSIHDDVSVVDLGLQPTGDSSSPERIVLLQTRPIRKGLSGGRPVESLHNLPRPRTSFVGRRDEMTAVRSLIGEARLVTLVGSGGCGKTRLALQVAAGLVDGYPDGLWLTELGPVIGSGAVALSVAAVLAIKVRPGTSVVETIAEHMAPRCALLVLDNCEHVVEASAVLVDSILSSCPHVRILATSRQPLGMSDEVTFRVPSLALPPGGGPFSPVEVAASEAAQLFVDRARRADPEFSIDDENVEAISRICHRLDGIPLAIELAAARLGVFSPREIAERLEDGLRILAVTGGADRGRQQTLHSSLDWSYDLLTGAEQTVLRRLGVFAGGFSLVAAETVCAGGAVAAHQVPDLIGLLVEKSLVVREPAGSASRYRLLESIAVYAVDRLIAEGEEETARDLHRDFFRDWMRTHAPDVEDDNENGDLGAITCEYSNLRGAMVWSAQRGDFEPIAEMAVALQWFWQAIGPLSEASSWLDSVLNQGELRPRLRAECPFARTYVWFGSFAQTEIGPLAGEGLDLARSLGDDRLRARFLVSLGLASLYVSDPTSYLDEGVALARASGDTFALAEGLQAYGLMAQLADPTAASLRLRESVDVAQMHRNSYTADTSLANLAVIALVHGRLTEALELAEEVLTRSHSPLYGLGFTAAAAVSATVYALRGESDAALRAADRLRDACRRTGVDLTGGTAPLVEALVATKQSGHADALPQSRLALEKAGTIPQTRVLALSCLAQSEIAAGRDDDARARAQDILALSRAFSFRPGESTGLLLEGLVARRAGDLLVAEKRVHESLAVASRSDALMAVIDGLEGLAGIGVEFQQWETAARLLGAADAARETIGYAIHLVMRREDESAIRAVLTADSFDRAHQEGRSLSLEGAVAYARRGRGERKRPKSGWSALTPAELQVAALVQTGLTNQEIGQRLFISARTVQTHLTHMFAKLSISTRTELAVEAGRRTSPPAS